jgi:hypothetical protein
MEYRDCFFLATVIFWAALLLASVASAQVRPEADAEACKNPNIQINVRPNAGGPPTVIYVGLRMVDLTEINDIKQTLTGDFAVLLTWNDARLLQFQGCEIALDKVWSPSVVFLNSGRLITSRPREVDIGPGCQVRYLQRYYGALASYHNLRDFPFDMHKFVVSLFPIDSSENEVQLVVDESFTGRRDLLNISDWKIGAVKGGIRRQKADAFNEFHSLYDFEITARRITKYYVWKVILPLCLIVAMSWCVFWIAPTQSDAQMTLSATSMLTLIAFIFATTNMVPELGYFTRLDLFIIGSTILVFLALLQSVTTSYLVAREREQLCVRIDIVCRVAFPLAFAALMLGVFIV